MRSKPSDAPLLESFSDVEPALKELGEIERDIRLIDLDTTEEISRLKQKAAEQTKPLEKRRKLLQAALEQFALHNKEAFRSVRSRKLRWGIIGFRKGTGKFKTLKGWTWKDVVEKLQSLKKRKYIRIKRTANKEALENDYRNKVLTDADLEIFGIRWDRSDEVYFETFDEETPDAEPEKEEALSQV